MPFFTHLSGKYSEVSQCTLVVRLRGNTLIFVHGNINWYYVYSEKFCNIIKVINTYFL